MFKTLEMLGPEHEFSLNTPDLIPLPITDRVIKRIRGRMANTVEIGAVSLGKELQKHVIELAPNIPFRSPTSFEEVMQDIVVWLVDFLEKAFGAILLGCGMHPLFELDEGKIWDHWDRKIYTIYDKIFNLRQHGWLNIQSFQLNLSFNGEKDGIELHNRLMNLLPYLPAIAAASPIFESKIGDYMDNRLFFYGQNQKEIPQIAGAIIPEFVNSFEDYHQRILGTSYQALLSHSAPELMKEWVNSRSAIIRFQRNAIEIRIIDEQECIKSDVALSCLIRALMRDKNNLPILPHKILVSDYNHIIKEGRQALVHHPEGPRAKDVCKYLYQKAWQSATSEEREFLPIIKKRIERGNISECILEQVKTKIPKTSPKEAIISVYSKLAEHLIKNEIFT